MKEKDLLKKGKKTETMTTIAKRDRFREVLDMTGEGTRRRRGKGNTNSKAELRWRGPDWKEG